MQDTIAGDWWLATGDQWSVVGAGVLEVVANHDGDAYRAVYTVQFEEVVFVLQCFRRNQNRDYHPYKRHGLDKVETETSRRRVQEVETEEVGENTVFHGSGNVFADLELQTRRNALPKQNSRAPFKTSSNARGLTEAQAAELMSVDQPKVSKLSGAVSASSQRNVS